MVGETYRISNLTWNGDAYFVFSDPAMVKTLENPNDEYVDLILEMSGFERTCRLTAGASRIFVSQFGIARGAERSACDEAMVLKKY